jgi:hypothetical protein
MGVLRGFESEVGSLRPSRQRIIFFLSALILMGVRHSEDWSELERENGIGRDYQQHKKWRS